MLVIKSESFFARLVFIVARSLEFLDPSAWHPDGDKISNPGEHEQMQPETRAPLMDLIAPRN